MTLTYRTKRRLQRIGLVSLILLIVCALVWFCWVIWLERYMVYSRDGASLNFELQAPETGEVAAPPSVDRKVTVFYNEGDDAVNATTELAQMTGYYIDADTLEKTLPEALEVVEDLPADAAVMIELKNAKGQFYYSSSLEDASPAAEMDVTAVDGLIDRVIERGLYAVAVVPAFRDYNFGLNHDVCGLPVAAGTHLWADSDYCYWLNPTHADTVNYLKQIIGELRSMGFDEVVFTDFCFPNTTDILFEGNQSEAITKAAADLVAACTTSSFAVSFKSTSAFPLPTGRSRLYLTGVGAKEVEEFAGSLSVTDPTINLVFMISTFDTRFDEYSVMRPIDCYADAE